MNLIKKTLIYAIGNFGAKGMNMLLVPLLTFYLTKEEIGEYDLTFVSILLFIPILSLQLSDSAFRWLISKENKTNVITNIYSYYFVAIVLAILIYFIINHLYPATITAIQLTYLLTQMIYLLVLQTARGLSHTKLYALSGLISSFFIVMLSLYTLQFTSLKVDGLLLSAILSYIITSLLIAVKIKLITYYRYQYLSLEHFKKYINYSLPLIPNTISWWGITMATRYIILFKLGIAANGLYAISAKVPALLTIITSFFTLAWQEELIIEKKTNGDMTAVIFRRYYTLLLSSLFLLLPFSYILLLEIVPPIFFESWKYVYFLLLAAVFQALSGFLGAQYLKTKETKKLFLTSVIAMITTLVLSFSLIGQYGLQGISFSTFVGMFLMFIVRLLDSSISQNYSIEILKIMLLMIISFAIYFYLLKDRNVLTISIVGTVLFLLYNRELLSISFKKVKNSYGKG